MRVRIYDCETGDGMTLEHENLDVDGTARITVRRSAPLTVYLSPVQRRDLAARLLADCPEPRPVPWRDVE